MFQKLFLFQQSILNTVDILYLFKVQPIQSMALIFIGGNNKCYSAILLSVDAQNKLLYAKVA